ncbi:uncharacterized protein TNCV_160441 [Trichonephila clavipes]|nr:uncharacterized protein TNCV_160441 [Trichonephila clavipes]
MSQERLSALSVLSIESEIAASVSYDIILRKFSGLGSNPGEDMGACKCIVPARHGGTLNNRRAASPLVWLVEGEERWEASDHPQSVLPLNWGGIESKSYCHLYGAQSYG